MICFLQFTAHPLSNRGSAPAGSQRRRVLMRGFGMLNYK